MEHTQKEKYTLTHVWRCVWPQQAAPQQHPLLQPMPLLLLLSHAQD